MLPGHRERFARNIGARFHTSIVEYTNALFSLVRWLAYGTTGMADAASDKSRAGTVGATVWGGQGGGWRSRLSIPARTKYSTAGRRSTSAKRPVLFRAPRATVGIGR